MGTPPDSEFWLDRPVLVTGATGLLGSWLVKYLVGLRAEVVCVIRDWVPSSELVLSGFLDRVRVVRGDVRDFPLMERTLGEFEIDTVFHLAAQTLVPVANRGARSTFETNVRGTWTVLEACHRSRLVKHVIVASSDKAYGASDQLPYTEDTSLRGEHPYDVSKACADLIARSYAISFQLPVCVTRCGNFYGGGDLNWNRIVPGTIRSILRRRRPIIRSDGSYIRDYFYVEDAALANVLLAERLGATPGMAGEAFNFSYERPMSVLNVVDSILKSMESTLEPDVRNEATGEIHAQYLCAVKARATLGWAPQFDFESGLERTIAWYREALGK